MDDTVTDRMDREAVDEVDVVITVPFFIRCTVLSFFIKKITFYLPT